VLSLKPVTRMALAPRAVRGATASIGAVDAGATAWSSVIVTLKVYSAERDSSNETYDVYVTSGNSAGAWDIVHFPQIATTGEKVYQARITALVAPVEITTATPGVSAVASGTFKTDTAGAGEGIKTLAAGKVRHGPLGPLLNVELVVAGTIATGIDFEVIVEGA